MFGNVWSYLLLAFDSILWYVLGSVATRALLIYNIAAKIWEMEMLSRINANLPVSKEHIDAHPSPNYIPAILVGILASSIEYALRSRFNKWTLLSCSIGPVILGGALEYVTDRHLRNS